MISGVSSTSTASTSGGTVSSAADMQDQFLTLLVAQLQNQDPTSPMDNAQLTSQMAQISTVSGIEKLNNTVESVTSQFAAMQMLQGTSMIGHTVLSEGNTLGLSRADGSDALSGTAAFDLSAPAANVAITITTPSGQLVDTIELGAAATGRNYFTWDGSHYTGQASELRFKVQATNGSAQVAHTPLSPNAVVATSISNGALMLELANGSSVNYNSVKAVF